MAGLRRNRLLVERALREPGAGAGKRPVRSVTVNAAEAPLGWLRSRGLVSERQYRAAERLRADWDRARLEPPTTSRWDALPRSPGGARPATLHPSEVQAAARRRFDAAVASAGPGLSDIVWRIVCAGEGMRDAERALGWPARAGRLVLAMALDRVADHYRM